MKGMKGKLILFLLVVLAIPSLGELWETESQARVFSQVEKGLGGNVSLRMQFVLPDLACERGRNPFVYLGPKFSFGDFAWVSLMFGKRFIRQEGIHNLTLSGYLEGERLSLSTQLDYSLEQKTVWQIVQIRFPVGKGFWFGTEIDNLYGGSDKSSYVSAGPNVGVGMNENISMGATYFFKYAAEGGFSGAVRFYLILNLNRKEEVK